MVFTGAQKESTIFHLFILCFSLNYKTTVFIVTNKCFIPQMFIFRAFLLHNKTLILLKYKLSFHNPYKCTFMIVQDSKFLDCHFHVNNCVSLVAAFHGKSFPADFTDVRLFSSVCTHMNFQCTFSLVCLSANLTRDAAMWRWNRKTSSFQKSVHLLWKYINKFLRCKQEKSVPKLKTFFDSGHMHYRHFIRSSYKGIFRTYCYLT